MSLEKYYSIKENYFTKYKIYQDRKFILQLEPLSQI